MKKEGLYKNIVKKIIAFHGKFLLFYDNNFIYNWILILKKYICSIEEKFQDEMNSSLKDKSLGYSSDFSDSEYGNQRKKIRAYYSGESQEK